MPERFLVSLTKDELANVVGHYSKYDLKAEFVKDSIRGEIELEISDIYKKHRLIDEFQKTEAVEAARTQIQKLLRTLTPIENKVKDLAQMVSKTK